MRVGFFHRQPNRQKHRRNKVELRESLRFLHRLCLHHHEVSGFSTHQVTPSDSQSASRFASQSLCELPCLTLSRIVFLRPGMPLGNFLLRTGGVTATEKLDIGAAPRDRTAPLRKKQLDLASKLRVQQVFARAPLPIESQHPGHAQLHHLSSYSAPSRKEIQRSSFREIRFSFFHHKLALLERSQNIKRSVTKGAAKTFPT